MSWEVLSTPVWYVPSSLEELFSIITDNPNSSVQLVAGDTGRGELNSTNILASYLCCGGGKLFSQPGYKATYMCVSFWVFSMPRNICCEFVNCYVYEHTLVHKH